MSLFANLCSISVAAGSSTFLGLAKRGLHGHLMRYFTFIESLPAVQNGITAFQGAQKSKVRSEINAIF